MPHSVRQRLLGYSVDHELSLLWQQRELPRKLLLHSHLAMLSDALAQGGEGARETEVVKCLWSQMLGDASDRVDPFPGSLARRMDLRSELRGRLPSQACELEQHRGERLADVVMQLLGDPQPLCLLRCDRSAGALPPFLLEIVKHLVVCESEVRDL